VVIQRINFNLKVRIIIQKGRVAEPCSLKLFPHEHNLILFRPDFHLEVFDIGRKLDVSLRFRVNSLLKISIFIPVLVLETLKVV